MTQAVAARVRGHWLLAGTFVVAVAGLIYELIAATVSSYLLGDSITQFSLVIGVFLSSMGLGAWLSRYVEDAERVFVASQIALGTLGGLSAPAFFFSYAYLGHVQGLLFGSLIAIGALAGMEIPLITRILQRLGAGRHVLANVLTADYIGALAASVLFPLAVIPFLGLMSAGLIFGLMNLGVALISLWLFRDRLPKGLWVGWAAATLVCTLGLWHSERLVSVVDAMLYEDDVIHRAETPYQRITLTRYRERIRLFLDASIQFDSRDEHRYHEALVHPVMSKALRRETVLILGGGDGLAAREVLKYPDVQAVTLVDLDPAVTTLFSTRPELVELNKGALLDRRLTVVNRDAWEFLEQTDQGFDVVILDLPDPKSVSTAKLYSREFYAVLVRHLNVGGALVTQATSPMFAREAFWSIQRTLASIGNPIEAGAELWTQPYHVYVPSFGAWGFVMASAVSLKDRPVRVPVATRFLTPESWDAALVFPPDMAALEAPVNSIQTHALMRLYEEGWSRWFQ